MCSTKKAGGLDNDRRRPIFQKIDWLTIFSGRRRKLPIHSIYYFILKMSGEDDFIDYNDDEEQQGEYIAKPTEEKDIKK